MNRTPFRLSLWSRVLRLCPPGVLGKARLARTILGASLHTRDIYVHARYGCTFLVPSLSEPIGFYLLVDGMYEPTTAEFLLRRLTPGTTFVDVGANIGVFTVLAARRVGSTGHVLAVEPSPRVFPYLEHNIHVNGLSNVRLQRCAAHDRDAQGLPFYEAPVEHFGMGALAPQFHVQPTDVRARTLDHILAEEDIGHVDLLKVDVEGFEAVIFRGARRLLTNQDSPLLVFEFCDWAEARVPDSQVGDAQRILIDYGYHIWRLSDFLCGRRPVPAVLTTGFETLVAVKDKG